VYSLSAQWVHECTTSCLPPTGTMLGTAIGKRSQLCGNTGVVSLVVPVDVLPLALANWTDHFLVLLAPSRWSQERASQPGKIELVTSIHTKMNINRIKIQLTCS
jgi:hypothetical protein